MYPNHHQFSAFAYVVREGSFSRAAERLGVTQSTVTQHMTKLEQSVGSQLVVRGRDGISLTRTGQEFYDLADRLVTLDSLVGEKLEGFSSLTSGNISIIANAPQPALRIVKAFRDQHPDVQIHFTLYDWNTSMAMLRGRMVDVAVITDPQKSDAWVMQKLVDTRYVAYVPRSNPLATRDRISLRDLVDETIIFPEEGALTERVVSAALNAAGLSFRRVVRTTTFPLMREAVLQGIGCSIFLADSSIVSDGLVEVPIDEMQASHGIYVAVPKDRSSLRLIRGFLDVALAEMQ